MEGNGRKGGRKEGKEGRGAEDGGGVGSNRMMGFVLKIWMLDFAMGCCWRWSCLFGWWWLRGWF